MLETSLVLASNGASSVSDHLCSKFRSTSGRMTAKYPTGFEEMNGGCLSSEIEREKKTARKLFRISGPSCFQVLGLRYESLPRLQKASRGHFLPVVLAGLESSSIYQSVSPNLDNVSLITCSPMSSPTCRGVCTVKIRRFNLGEMTTCLQSRCSPS